MSDISSKELVERFLERKFRSSRSYATKETYQGIINRFSDFVSKEYGQRLDELLANLLDGNIDPVEVLDNFYTYLTKAPNPLTKKIGYGNGTIRCYVTTAKDFLNDAGCKIYSEDIRRKFKLPRKVITYTQGLTKESISQILRLANYRLSALILLACSSGMRISEMLSLRVSDVNYTRPTTIFVRAATTKTRESRVVHISSEATGALQDLLAKSGKKDDDYIFLENYEQRLEKLGKSNHSTGILKKKMERRIQGISEEEKHSFRLNATKHSFENQLRRVTDKIPQLSKRSENGRYQVHFHAFRYFFKTQVTDAHQSDFAEALMGHKSLKLVYYRQNEEKRRRTYLDVEHALTISETEKIDQNYSMMQKDNLELRGIVDSLSRQLQSLEQRIEIRS